MPLIRAIIRMLTVWLTLLGLNSFGNFIAAWLDMEFEGDFMALYMSASGGIVLIGYFLFHMQKIKIGRQYFQNDPRPYFLKFIDLSFSLIIPFLIFFPALLLLHYVDGAASADIPLWLQMALIASIMSAFMITAIDWGYSVHIARSKRRADKQAAHAAERAG